MDELTESLQEPGARDRALRAIDSEFGRSMLQSLQVDHDQARQVLEGNSPLERALPTARVRIFEGVTRPPLRGRPPRPLLEAIVRLSGRPVYLVQDDRVNLSSGLNTFERPLEPHREVFDKAVPAVGQVKLQNHRMEWAGTAWLVGEDLVVTNRHVAELFAEPDGRGAFRFAVAAPGVLYAASVDFLEEHERSATRIFEVLRIEYIAPGDGPDMALLRLAAPAETPLTLSSKAVAKGQLIGVIGYPADDYRNGASAIEKYFGTIFDKKRFAPGFVKSASSGTIFQHDCTTLGGNSGSLVLDLNSGEAVGLHFAGSFKTSNFAVTAGTLNRMVRGLTTFVSLSESANLEANDGAHKADFFEGRTGYDPAHLGTENMVPLPDYSALMGEIVTPEGGTGVGNAVADYQHFSLVLHERRVPLFTAVNIDGEQSRRLKRGTDKWFADLRYPANAQLRRGHYSHPNIDRGHMVRREDPNWGEQAELANDDTFHYTNAAPQHSRLNQGRSAWLGLEHYVLESARTEGFRVSVFTGPVLLQTDRMLSTVAGDVQVPEEFWKVIVARHAENGGLQATGYLLGQGAMLDQLEGTEFRYGQYGTFQVTVQSIADATGLGFGDLAAADPLSRQEAPRARVRRLIRSLDDIIL